MSEPSIFFSDVNERQGSFLRRTFVLGGLTALGVLGLTARLGQLQVVQAQEYTTLATANQFNFRLVPPPRGIIRDRDGVITRLEMMGSRTKAFKALDKDGDNLLSFEEWAVATSDRFASADANKDGKLTPAEFATTAPKRTPKPKCTC